MVCQNELQGHFNQTGISDYTKVERVTSTRAPASDHLAGVIVFVKANFPADCYGPLHWRRVGRRCIIMRSLEVALQLDLGVAPYRILRLVQDSLALYNKKSVPKQRSRRGHWVLVHNDVGDTKTVRCFILDHKSACRGKVFSQNSVPKGTGISFN